MPNMNGTLGLEKPLSFLPIDTNAVQVSFVLADDPRRFTWDQSGGIFEVAIPPEKPQLVGKFQTEPKASELVNILARFNPCLSSSVYIKLGTVTFEDKYSKTFHYSSMAVCSNGTFISIVAPHSKSQSLDTGLVVALVIAVTLLVVACCCCCKEPIALVLLFVFFACACSCERAKASCTCCRKKVRSVEREEPTYIVSQVMDRNSNYATVT